MLNEEGRGKIEGGNIKYGGREGRKTRRKGERVEINKEEIDGRS